MHDVWLLLILYNVLSIEQDGSRLVYWGRALSFFVRHLLWLLLHPQPPFSFPFQTDLTPLLHHLLTGHESMTVWRSTHRRRKIFHWSFSIQIDDVARCYQWRLWLWHHPSGTTSLLQPKGGLYVFWWQFQYNTRFCQQLHCLSAELMRLAKRD